MNFGMPNFGFVESLIVLAVIVVLTVWPGCRICRKAGYPAILGLLFFLPLLNVCLWLYLAFAEWPLERRAGGVSRD